MTIADEVNDHPTRTTAPVSIGTVVINVEGAKVTGAVVDHDQHEQIAAGDWTPVLAMFNLDPTAFEVVDDTVQMSTTSSTWQQSKRTENGDRDVVDLTARRYSYSARFRRITAAHIAPAVVESWRAALQVRDRAKPAPSDVGAGTYVALIADPQLGKKGTDEAVDNWRRGVRAHIEAARKLGPKVEAVHVAFMGDETENVVNSYGNQPHTIELNRTRQLELDYDLRVWTMREALGLRKPVSASSVISNHGEWTRNGGKEPVTSANDNASTYVARQVARLFDELAPFTKREIDWTIGDTHPGVTLDLSGALTYFSHGYIEKGRGTSTETRTRGAIERQIIGRTDDLGSVLVWFMAHYHHFYANTFEGRTLFGCPAIEAERSSEYMLDQYGVWSRPGVLGMLVGSAMGRDGWSDLNVF